MASLTSNPSPERSYASISLKSPSNSKSPAQALPGACDDVKGKQLIRGVVIGAAFGTGLGVILGAAFDNMGMGTAMGSGIGAGIGSIYPACFGTDCKT